MADTRSFAAWGTALEGYGDGDGQYGAPDALGGGNSTVVDDIKGDAGVTLAEAYLDVAAIDAVVAVARLAMRLR